jgi:integrase
MLTPERQQAVEVNSRSHLTMDELIDVLQMAKDESVRDWAMFVVCFRHAFRSAEVASLRWSDIDWANGTLSVRRLKGGMFTEQPLFRTKGSPVLDEVAALKAWRGEREERPGNPYIFTTQKSAAHIPSVLAWADSPGKNQFFASTLLAKDQTHFQVNVPERFQ